MITSFSQTIIYSEDFESITGTYTTTQASIPGLNGAGYNWSYSYTGNSPRLRLNSGFGIGNGALTLDRSTNNNLGVNYVILEIDMSSYLSSTELEFTFDYTHHGEEAHANDKVWIRGDSTASWAEAYDLYANRPATCVFDSVTIDIDSILSNAGQVVSSSFQVRFGQEDNYGAASCTASDGFTFDNIEIIEICTTIDATVNACGQYTFGDSTYTSSGVYTHTFDVDSTSCDSTVILTLNLDTTVGVATSYSSRYWCSQNAYFWNGMLIWSSGTYSHLMPGAAACGGDSIAYLNFCKGYSGGNQYYNYSGCNGVYTPVGYKTQSGTYSQTINTGCGCFYRKYYTVNLTRPTVYRTVNACGQYTFGDSTYTSSGVYTHTFDVDSTYCDSTVILTLNLDTTVGVATSYSSRYWCSQNAYFWNGMLIWSSGTYSHLMPGAAACGRFNSIIKFL